jgi:hypothetical protein
MDGVLVQEEWRMVWSVVRRKVVNLKLGSEELPREVLKHICSSLVVYMHIDGYPCSKPKKCV